MFALTAMEFCTCIQKEQTWLLWCLLLWGKLQSYWKGLLKYHNTQISNNIWSDLLICPRKSQPCKLCNRSLHSFCLFFLWDVGIFCGKVLLNWKQLTCRVYSILKAANTIVSLKFFSCSMYFRGEDCGGCRRSNSTERPHAFQVILTERPPLELSANNEQEMADWMQLLCQSVSKGVGADFIVHVHFCCLFQYYT